ncbi:hypothetical protein [Hyphomicrobium sp.]|uniref:hypothetical protein n=1 Tax=Hyphomicrobium sp. TaxID=82 RepID=UPI002FDEF922
MSLTTRAMTAFTVLSLAAIPVAALTINTGSSEKAAIGGNAPAVDAQDTTSAGHSRLVPQNATIDPDAMEVVTGAVSAPRRLVPQNPANEPPGGAAVAEAEPAAAEEAAPIPVSTHQRPKRRKAKTKVKQGGAPGSLELLFQGPPQK